MRNMYCTLLLFFVLTVSEQSYTDIAAVCYWRVTLQLHLISRIQTIGICNLGKSSNAGS